MEKKFKQNWNVIEIVLFLIQIQLKFELNSLNKLWQKNISEIIEDWRREKKNKTNYLIHKLNEKHLSSLK